MRIAMGIGLGVIVGAFETGSVHITEQPDTTAVVAFNLNRSTVAPTEASDTLVASSTSTNRSAIASTEANDTAAAVASKFDPRDVAASWFPAWLGAVSDGSGGILSFSDLAGSNHLTTVSATHPTLTAGAQNGQAGATFVAGSLTFLQSGNVNLLATGLDTNCHDFTMWCVCKLTNNSTDYAFFGNANASAGGTFIESSSSGVKWIINSYNKGSTQDGTSNTTAYHILMVRYDGAGAYDMQLDGVDATLTNQFTPTSPDSANTARGRIGMGAGCLFTGAFRFLSGTVLDAGICSSKISDANRTKLTTYLKAVYAL